MDTFGGSIVALVPKPFPCAEVNQGILLFVKQTGTSSYQFSLM